MCVYKTDLCVYKTGLCVYKMASTCGASVAVVGGEGVIFIRVSRPTSGKSANIVVTTALQVIRPTRAKACRNSPNSRRGFLHLILSVPLRLEETSSRFASKVPDLDEIWHFSGSIVRGLHSVLTFLLEQTSSLSYSAPTRLCER